MERQLENQQLRQQIQRDRQQDEGGYIPRLGLFDLGQSAIIVGKLGEPGTILCRLPTERPSQ
jgi:hypothetical protein